MPVMFEQVPADLPTNRVIVGNQNMHGYFVRRQRSEQ
jgi:hypothetical protein